MTISQKAGILLCNAVSSELGMAAGTHNIDSSTKMNGPRKKPRLAHRSRYCEFYS